MPPNIDRLLAERDWMRALARSLVVDEHAAEDLVQDATVVALTRPPDQVHAMRAWLRRVIRSVHLNRLRGDDRRAARELASEVVRGGAQACERPDDVVATWEVRREVVEAVLALDEPYRTTVLLRFFEGLTRNEVAQRMEVSSETVHTRQRRAVDQLRERLRGHAPENWNRKSLALFLIARGDTAAGPPVGSVQATALGVTVMSTTKTMALVAAALFALGLGAWWVTGDSDDVHASRDATDVAQGIDGPSPLRRTRQDPQRDDRSDPSETTLESALADGTIDRDRDLHGRVVDGEGSPVAGADLQVRRYPLARIDALVLEAAFTATPGRSFRTAADGTFRIRLRVGEDVNLHVAKNGYATQEFARLHAGEKAELVLANAVPLTIRVIDAGGSPVEGVKLMLFSNPRVGETFAFETATTDADGVHVFTTLPGGLQAYLEPQHPAFGQAGWERVELPENGAEEMTVTLPAGRRITGRVLGPDGAPLAGSQVGIGWPMVNSVSTRDDGTYEIPGWTGKGWTRLHATAPGFGGQMVRVGEKAVIDFRLAAGVTLAGRLVDSLGAPLPRVHIAANIVERGGRDAQISGATAVTDEDGRFALADLRADAAHTLRALDFDAGTVNRVVGAVGEPGKTLDLGDVATVVGRRVTGRVLDADGAPIAHVTVELGRGGKAAGSSRDRISCVTDDIGRFSASHVPPGSYAAIVTRDRAELATASLDVPGDRDPPPLEIRPRTGDLFVVRTLEDSGAPVTGVLVGVTTESGTRLSGRTDLRGEATFDLTGDVQRVTALIIEEDRRRLYVVPIGGAVAKGARDHRVVFVRGAEVSGVVVDANGDPIANGEFIEYDLPGSTGRLGTITDGGRFRITVPERTPVDLIFHPSASRGQKREFRTGLIRDVTAPATGLRMTVAAPALDRSVRVRVLDGAGRPVAGMRVFAPHRGAPRRAAILTGDDGRATIDRLPEMPLFVSTPFSEGHPAASSWAAPESVKVIPDGQEIVLRLRRAVALRGVVVDVNGAPVAEATVYVEGLGTTGSVVVACSEDGRFALLIPAEFDGPFIVKAWSRDGNVWSVGELADVPSGAEGLRVEIATQMPRER